jgi:hypothetical protein
MTLSSSTSDRQAAEGSQKRKRNKSRRKGKTETEKRFEEDTVTAERNEEE